MPYCAVKLCGKSSNNSSFVKGGISFHRFPHCKKIKKIWIDATKQDSNWFPTTHSVICSRHFTEDCYKPLKKRILFENAVPTLFLPVVVTMSVQDQDEPSLMIPSMTYQRVTDVDVLLGKKSALDNGTHPLNMDPSRVKDSVENLKQSDSPSHNLPTSSTDPLENVAPTQSYFGAMERRRLIRTICSLQEKLKNKNIKMKRLRAANRRLKLRLHSFEMLLKEDDVETEDKVEKIIVYS